MTTSRRLELYLTNTWQYYSLQNKTYEVTNNTVLGLNFDKKENI